MLKDLTISEIMKRANALKIVIPAFNISYLPMVEPVLNALKKNNTFALLEVARPDIEKFDAKSFKAVVEEYRKFADPQVSRLHLDHLPVIDEDGLRVNWEPIMAHCIELKFESVMIDGSRLSLDENIAVTKRTVEMAHHSGIPAEAELGAVLGHEAGPLPPYEEIFKSGKGFTDEKEAQRFVTETNVDWLSVAVGNIHGAIRGAAKDAKKVTAHINIPHLKKLHAITKIPLVLHGGSGIARDDVLESVKNGITKINVATEIRQAYERALRERPNDFGYAKDSLTKKMDEIICDYYGIKNSVEKLENLNSSTN